MVPAGSAIDPVSLAVTRRMYPIPAPVAPEEVLAALADERIGTDAADERVGALAALQDVAAAAPAQDVTPMAAVHPVVDGTPEQNVMSPAAEHGVQPGGWRRNEGKGRVCVLTPGHNLEIWQHPSYQKLLLNSIHWCSQAQLS